MLNNKHLISNNLSYLLSNQVCIASARARAGRALGVKRALVRACVGRALGAERETCVSAGPRRRGRAPAARSERSTRRASAPAATHKEGQLATAADHGTTALARRQQLRRR